MIVEVTRGDLVESLHRVDRCALDERGHIIVEDGDIDTPIFLRSSAKPFIAAAILAAGARERFGLTMEEIAVIAASHFGEPFHIAAVQSILAKLGLDETALQCGTHLPYNERAAHAILRSGATPSALSNNCSGKHAGILALTLLLGADTKTYLATSHPAQQAILQFCARMSDDDADHWPLGVDGCGIPVYATSLRRAALAFMRFATLHGIADRDARALLAVRDAMISYPAYGSGTGELDAMLMETGAGSIACKVGAEGVHGVTVTSPAIGMATKVLDGASRARGPATIASLAELGVLTPAAQAKLAPLATPVVYNRAGRRVGEIRVRNVAVLEASLPSE